MTTVEILRRRVVREPDDDTLRLVLADAYEDAGDGDRAAFVRTQMALARTSRRCTPIPAKWCPVCGDCVCDRSGIRGCPLHGPESPHSNYRVWTDQANRLLRENWAQWVPHGVFAASNCMGVPAADYRDVPSWGFSRGSVELIKCDVHHIYGVDRERVRRLFTAEPVRRVYLRGRRPRWTWTRAGDYYGWTTEDELSDSWLPLDIWTAITPGADGSRRTGWPTARRAQLALAEGVARWGRRVAGVEVPSAEPAASPGTGSEVL